MKMFFDRGIRLTLMLNPVSNSHLRNLPVLARCLYSTNAAGWNTKYLDTYPIYGASSNYQLTFLKNIHNCHRPFKYNISKNDTTLTHYYDSKNFSRSAGVEPKISVFQKMKQLTKDYWHVLIPVHTITSVGWILLFYILIKNGVDVVQIMEYFNLSEKYLQMLRNSNAGNWAIAYILYKIITPLRYMVTVGATTMAIRYLSKRGYMKASSFRKPLQPAQSKKHLPEHKADTKTEQHKESPKT